MLFKYLIIWLKKHRFVFSIFKYSKQFCFIRLVNSTFIFKLDLKPSREHLALCQRTINI